MKSTKGKAKQPPPPEPVLVKMYFESRQEIELLEKIKSLTNQKAGTKAIMEALINYPNVSKRADALNDELRKVNREYETLENKWDTVKRGLSLIMVPLEKNISDYKLMEVGDNECKTCGEELDKYGDCPNECEQDED